MNTVIKEIITTATFDNDILAEKILYQSKDGSIDKEILAIMELGETEKEHAPALFHQRNSVTVTTEGLITVCMDDVPTPQRGDKITYNGKIYYVAAEYLRDHAGNQITLRVQADVKGFITK